MCLILLRSGANDNRLKIPNVAKFYEFQNLILFILKIRDFWETLKFVKFLFSITGRWPPSYVDFDITLGAVLTGANDAAPSVI